MSNNVPWNHSETCSNAGAANLCYKITLLPTGKPCMHDVTQWSGGLSLSPGTVMDDSGLACVCPVSTITLPPCRHYEAARLSVPVEIPCRAIGGCSSCLPGCLWTSTEKQANPSAVRAGDTVTYTVTFTNHSSVSLDMVCISDDIPEGAAVIPDSIHPAPGPGESLQTGISLGRLGAGQSSVLTYAVIANFGASCQLVNCARVRYCYTDCRGCCQYGMSGLRSCIVRQIPANARIAVTKCANKNSVYRRCEEIQYTVTISNPGKETLTDVVAYDNVPQGLCYKPGSTVKNGGEAVDENPQDGIPIGTLNPGESHSIAFILLVCIEPCRSCPVTAFINTASAKCRAGKLALCAKSTPWVVTLENDCISQCVQKRLCIADFKRIRYYYVYHRGVDCFETDYGCIIIVRFGIAIRYLNRDGEKRIRFFEDSIIFCGIPEKSDLAHLMVHFSNLSCDIDCFGGMTIRFEARLRCP
ncbi:conserved repeat domain-containing protein [Oscillibacter sp. PC13]|nr:conserved repeat domain-containing protein [Oscillibacter sp. PC13]